MVLFSIKNQSANKTPIRKKNNLESEELYFLQLWPKYKLITREVN